MKKTEHSTKATYVAYVASSIDGRISLTKKTRPDWTSKEDWKFFQESLSRCDAVVVGRNTYHAAAPHLRKRNTIVLSGRLKTFTRRGSVIFVNPAHVDLLEFLKKYRRVAVLGGGMVYRTMIENGLLDELYVTIEPLVFGRGKVMVAGGKKTTQLTLLSAKRLNRNGTLLLHYKINHRRS